MSEPDGGFYGFNIPQRFVIWRADREYNGGQGIDGDLYDTEEEAREAIWANIGHPDRYVIKPFFPSEDDYKNCPFCGSDNFEDLTDGKDTPWLFCNVCKSSWMWDEIYGE